MIAPADLTSILQAGVLAPSADNRHLFEFQESANGLSLFGNEAYRNARFQHRFLCLVSFGAVVENMVIRAARLGYRANLRLLPDPDRPALIAELNLTKGVPSEIALDAAIPGRHTNRRVVFWGPRVDDAGLDRFKGLLDGIDGVALNFCDSGDQRSQLLRLISIAETERFNTPALHHDLFSAIRFDVGWHASRRRVLRPQRFSWNLECGGPLRNFAAGR